MKTLFFTFALTLAMFNICFAEINQYTNEFDNSTVTYSYFDRGNNENSPIEIVLRKTVYSNKTEYMMFLSKRYAPSRRYLALENIKFKINNNTDDILDIDTRISQSAVGHTYSLNITPYIQSIQNAESIKIQIPSYTKEKPQIRYTYYEVDKNILQEWKTVISK